jgi:hypothetical protein
LCTVYRSVRARFPRVGGLKYLRAYLTTFHRTISAILNCNKLLCSVAEVCLTQEHRWLYRRCFAFSNMLKCRKLFLLLHVYVRVLLRALLFPSLRRLGWCAENFGFWCLIDCLTCIILYLCDSAILLHNYILGMAHSGGTTRIGLKRCKPLRRRGWYLIVITLRGCKMVE